MSSEAKFYPKANEGRQSALMSAFTENSIVTGNNPLTQRTKDRLNAIKPLYDSKLLNMAVKKAMSAGLMAEKEKMRLKTAMYCSHFLQVLNMCIKRGEYSAGIRALYGLPVENDKLPALLVERKITAVAENIINGEQRRVAAGGVPMDRPSAAEVEAVYTSYLNLILTGSNAKDALDNAQEEVQRLNKEADGVIKKVWNEVETFYSEQSRESMRNHARRWGVVYDRKGYKKKVTGIVTDSQTQLPLHGVKLRLASGRKTVITSIDGKFTLSTSLMGEQKLSALRSGYLPFEDEIMLYENRDTACRIEMKKEEN